MAEILKFVQRLAAGLAAADIGNDVPVGPALPEMFRQVDEMTDRLDILDGFCQPDPFIIRSFITS